MLGPMQVTPSELWMPWVTALPKHPRATISASIRPETSAEWGTFLYSTVRPVRPLYQIGETFCTVLYLVACLCAVLAEHIAQGIGSTEEDKAERERERARERE